MKRLRRLFLLVASLLGAGQYLPANAISTDRDSAVNSVLDRVSRIQQEAKKRRLLNDGPENPGLTQWVNWPNWPNWNNWLNWPNWGNWYNY